MSTRKLGFSAKLSPKMPTAELLKLLKVRHFPTTGHLSLRRPGPALTAAVPP